MIRVVLDTKYCRLGPVTIPRPPARELGLPSEGSIHLDISGRVYGEVTSLCNVGSSNAFPGLGSGTENGSAIPDEIKRAFGICLLSDPAQNWRNVDEWSPGGTRTRKLRIMLASWR